jgi:hypothetical protein
MSKNIDKSPYMYEISSNAINKSLKIPKGQSEIHDLVDRYEISVSQMTTDIFHLS